MAPPLPPPPPADQPGAAAALPLIASCVAIIACAAASVAVYMLTLHRRRRSQAASGCHSSLWNNANYRSGGLDSAAAAGAIEELRDRCHHQPAAPAAWSRQRSGLLQLLAPGWSQFVWNLPAILELAEASAVMALPDATAPPRHRAGGRNRTGRVDRLRKRRLAAASGVCSRKARRRWLPGRRRAHGRRELLPRMFEALLANQSGLQCCCAQQQTSLTRALMQPQPAASNALPTSSDDGPPTVAAGADVTIESLLDTSDSSTDSGQQHRLQLVLRMTSATRFRAARDGAATDSPMAGSGEQH